MSQLFLIFGSFYLVITNIGVILHHNLTTMKDMKYYHLTIKRNNKLETIFAQLISIASFIVIEHEFGRNTIVLYSREVEKEEYEFYYEKSIY